MNENFDFVMDTQVKTAHTWDFRAFSATHALHKRSVANAPRRRVCKTLLTRATRVRSHLFLKSKIWMGFSHFVRIPLRKRSEEYAQEGETAGGEDVSYEFGRPELWTPILEES